ncbi:hypothetical protein GGI23_005465, partial [Coemansia sp. RSA 2559]
TLLERKTLTHLHPPTMNWSSKQNLNLSSTACFLGMRSSLLTVSLSTLSGSRR